MKTIAFFMFLAMHFVGFLYTSIPGILVALFIFAMAMYIWRSRAKILAIPLFILLSVPLLIMGTSFVYNSLHTYTHRFRLTVEIETPTGIKSGSSVIQVSETEYLGHWNPDSSGVKTKIRGEAVFVDLGNGRNIIATLRFGPDGGDSDTLSRLAAMALGRYYGKFYIDATRWTGCAELHGNLVPTLVTFNNLNDPYSVQVVHPESISDIFGQGYSIKRVWIEMTKDGVTRKGIVKRMPWIDHMEQYRKGLANPFNGKVRYFSRSIFTM